MVQNTEVKLLRPTRRNESSDKVYTVQSLFNAMFGVYRNGSNIDQQRDKFTKEL